jgi:hypothetical protein
MNFRTNRFETLPEETRALKQNFTNCSPEGPLIVFVSKMIPVPKKHLPEHRAKVLSPEELAERREAAKLRLALKKVKDEAMPGEALTQDQIEILKGKTDSINLDPNKIVIDDQDETAFVAFARVFSG